MSAYVKEAQKERETWLTTIANSNSNPGPDSAQNADQNRGNSQCRPEISNDDNIRLLCQKIGQNPTIEPSEDSVNFLIVKLLASHIEQRQVLDYFSPSH